MQSPWRRLFEEEFPGKLHPFGSLVIYLPPKLGPQRDFDGEANMKWDATARYGIFAGYHMNRATNWNKAYLVWDLMTFRGADLHVSTTWREQRIGIPMIVRKCEAPVADGLRFPLKVEYDRIIGDLFDPAFHEAEPSVLLGHKDRKSVVPK